MRYDKFDHWVDFDKKNSRSRCKFTGCDGFTHAYCTKCEIHLCCSVNRNCYREFHKPEGVRKQAKLTKLLKKKNPASSAKIGNKTETKSRKSKRADDNKESNISNRLRSATKMENVTGEAASKSMPESSMSTLKENGVHKPKKVLRSPNHPDLIFSSNRSAGANPNIPTVSMECLQSSQTAAGGSLQRRSRRKSKHQVKEIGEEDLKFIETDDQN